MKLRECLSTCWAPNKETVPAPPRPVRGLQTANSPPRDSLFSKGRAPVLRPFLVGEVPSWGPHFPASAAQHQAVTRRWPAHCGGRSGTQSLAWEDETGGSERSLLVWEATEGARVAGDQVLWAGTVHRSMAGRCQVGAAAPVLVGTALTPLPQPPHL